MFDVMVSFKSIWMFRIKVQCTEDWGSITGGAQDPVITFPTGRAYSLHNNASTLYCPFAAGCGVVLPVEMCGEERSQAQKDPRERLPRCWVVHVSGKLSTASHKSELQRGLFDKARRMPVVPKPRCPPACPLLGSLHCLCRYWAWKTTALLLRSEALTVICSLLPGASLTHWFTLVM